ncbi:hypothetical protein RchiOBHm_Chr3g0471931 [Rosa chinensis]|uniref:Uncharacterized protein n=1 Tax=Rosa chinensis TaxID=74649 RepID=A0A2P6RBG9_ROSCH|nr:hypothetical protein RchiOBHm_Chr3g0471931 [Rosa chinensis]
MFRKLEEAIVGILIPSCWVKGILLQQNIQAIVAIVLFTSSGAEIKCKLALGSVEHIVAYATVMDCDDRNQLIHGAPLGDDICVFLSMRRLRRKQ